ncbi:MAG TPA: diguanylate cyclase [Pyrinomonadaceae bacterium]|jgi:diguanylate cyclase (GGDEF)-like protein/PAS domain S-box-containing protein|nr:diguanylate cyclase [Pyrinomonadaceae bacterium]
MFLNSDNSISRIGRKLWPLPVFVIPAALAISLIAPGLLGSALTEFVVSFSLAQIMTSGAVWFAWKSSREQLTGVKLELSSLQGIVDVSRDAIIGVTTEGVIMSWNRGARAIYGHTAKEALGSPVSMLFDNRRGLEATSLFEKVSRGESVTQHEMVHLKKDHTPIDISLTICPIMDGKSITGASVVARDITERKRAEGSMAQQAAAMKASMDGMAIIDRGGVCTYINDAYANIFGYADTNRLIGASWEMFFYDEELNRLKEQIMPAVWRDGSWRGEAIGLKLNGGTLPLEISISSVDGGGLVQVVRDITEQKKIEETLRNTSLKDDLTGLFNRRGLLKQAAPYFDFARRQKESLLLLFIDLDGMKKINDEFGHNEGDVALVKTAEILNRSFRSSDIIARLGGDEFTVLVTDRNANKHDAIKRLNENLKAYNKSEKRGFKLAFSIGVAQLEPERMTCFEELLEQADQAMYEQKRLKRHRATERGRNKKLREATATTTESSAQLAPKSMPFALSSNSKAHRASRGTFDNAAIGMAVVSVDGSWLQVNDALCKLLGYSEQELRATSFQRLTHQEDLRHVQSYIQRVLEGYIPSYEQEKRYIHEHGHTVWVLWHVSLLKDSETGAKRLFFQVQDISDRKKAEEKLTQDTLTGLPNRARLHDLIKLRVARKSSNKDRQYAVLLLDVDRFKLVNDSLGNASGDQLLVQIAQRVKTCLRQDDVLGRVGGDEFAVLLDDVTGEEEACSVATRIQQALSISFNLLGQEVYTTMSIGIALGGDHGEQVSDILRDAETAMHRAKDCGKARYEVFGRDMHGESMSRLKMETDLRNACERNELFVDYQPIVSLGSRTLIGFEALVRWRHPEFGLVPPKDFIPVAEETGQILTIGQVVLESACRQARYWQESYPAAPPLFVSVNLSVKQFNQPGLVEDIARLLREFELAPRCLKLEITESVFSDNIEAAVGLLTQLRSLGVQLSIDDFGTGYSSLSYLQRFPIDTLKIDRSFVTQMMENEENLAIVRTIVALARNLGMDVVAEGVETEDQLMLLKKLECENGQGFLFSTPLGDGQVDQFIADNTVDVALVA